MEVEQEEDLLAGRIITAVAAFAIAISFALCGWAYLLMRSNERHIRPSLSFPERLLGGPVEVSAVEQEPFARGAAADRDRRAAQHRLASYGWVDRDKGLVHIPIERAIDLYLERGGGR